MMGIEHVDGTVPHRTRKMPFVRFRLRTLIAVVALLAGLLATWRAVSYHLAYARKVEYSRDWARSSLLAAESYRKRASEPDCPAKDAAELRWLARKEELISRRYAEIAAQPWRPYPTASAPLLTRQDWDQLGAFPGRPPAQAGR